MHLYLGMECIRTHVKKYLAYLPSISSASVGRLLLINTANAVLAPPIRPLDHACMQ